MQWNLLQVLKLVSKLQPAHGKGKGRFILTKQNRITMGEEQQWQHEKRNKN
jgi:hypothetical protein